MAIRTILKEEQFGTIMDELEAARDKHKTNDVESFTNRGFDIGLSVMWGEAVQIVGKYIREGMEYVDE